LEKVCEAIDCSATMDQIAEIESVAEPFQSREDARVHIVEFS
jgi:hypothetical protein